MSNWDIKKPNEYPRVSDTYQEYEKWPKKSPIFPLVPPAITEPPVPADVIDALKEFQKEMEKQNKKLDKKSKAKPKKKRKPRAKKILLPPPHDEHIEEREV
jgi:hypothetical protein